MLHREYASAPHDVQLPERCYPSGDVLTIAATSTHNVVGEAPTVTGVAVNQRPLPLPQQPVPGPSTQGKPKVECTALPSHGREALSSRWISMMLSRCERLLRKRSMLASCPPSTTRHPPSCSRRKAVLGCGIGALPGPPKRSGTPSKSSRRKCSWARRSK